MLKFVVGNSVFGSIFKQSSVSISIVTPYISVEHLYVRSTYIRTKFDCSVKAQDGPLEIIGLVEIASFTGVFEVGVTFPTSCKKEITP